MTWRRWGFDNEFHIGGPVTVPMVTVIAAIDHLPMAFGPITRPFIPAAFDIDRVGLRRAYPATRNPAPTAVPPGISAGDPDIAGSGRGILSFDDGGPGRGLLHHDRRWHPEAKAQIDADVGFRLRGERKDRGASRRGQGEQGGFHGVGGPG